MKLGLLYFNSSELDIYPNHIYNFHNMEIRNKIIFLSEFHIIQFSQYPIIILANGQSSKFDILNVEYLNLNWL